MRSKILFIYFIIYLFCKYLLFFIFCAQHHSMMYDVIVRIKWKRLKTNVLIHRGAFSRSAQKLARP